MIAILFASTAFWTSVEADRIVAAGTEHHRFQLVSGGFAWRTKWSGARATSPTRAGTAVNQVPTSPPAVSPPQTLDDVIATPPNMENKDPKETNALIQALNNAWSVAPTTPAGTLPPAAPALPPGWGPATVRNEWMPRFPRWSFVYRNEPGFRYVAVPFWTLFLVPAAAYGVITFIRHRRLRALKCTACGYPLNDDGLCTECGPLTPPAGPACTAAAGPSAPTASR
ncbi:MAG: hypothetical protein DHS20C14_09690 [Phycisphaeraceae bacterium]|nr:MAG: hypothetical protein DHS20C14_09690 [Phycisphaeraceae bacterium]